VTKTVDLSNYTGNSYIRFAFETTQDSNNLSNVVYIDNIHFYDASILSVEDLTKLAVTITTDIEPLTCQNI